MSILEYDKVMGYGQTGVLHDSWHRVVVLLPRPFAAAFSRQAQGTVGGASLFLERSSKIFEVVWLRGSGVPMADRRLLEENVTAKLAAVLEERKRKVQPR